MNISHGGRRPACFSGSGRRGCPSCREGRQQRHRDQARILDGDVLGKHVAIAPDVVDDSINPPGKRRLCAATGALSQPWCEHEGRYGQPPPIAGGRTLPGLASRGSATLPASPLASVAVGAGERAGLRGDGLAPMINLAELGVQDSHNQASGLFLALDRTGRPRDTWIG